MQRALKLPVLKQKLQQNIHLVAQSLAMDCVTTTVECTCWFFVTTSTRIHLNSKLKLHLISIRLNVVGYIDIVFIILQHDSARMLVI